MSDAATPDLSTGDSGASAPATAATPNLSVQEGAGNAAPSAIPPAQAGTNQPQANEWIGDVQSYTDDGITMPEGVELHDDVAEALSSTCKKMGLSQKAFSTIINDMVPVLEAREQAALNEFRQSNLEQFRNDPEIGGAKVHETMKVANKAYMSLCPEPARKLLEQTGLNCHPDLIRMFYQLGRQISADSAPRGGGTQGGDPLARFFNKSKMN